MEAIPTKRLMLTMVAYAGLVTMAFAQPPGGGRGGPPGGGRGDGMGGLLRSDEVREELELMDDQVEQLRELEQEMREEMRGKMRERFRGEGGERRGRPDRESMRAMFEEFREQAETRMGEILTTQQLSRLKQINLQQQMDRGGERALMGGAVADALDLTDDQKEQLRERSREVRAEMDKKIQAAREEAKAQLMEILSSEQRAKLEEMTGEPFAMSRPEGRRGGPGGAERGGRGGRGGADRGGRPGPPERGGRGGRGGGRQGRPGPPPRD